MSQLTIEHHQGHSIGLGVGSVEILRYVYGADIPQFEAPKPYLHPIRTLSAPWSRPTGPGTTAGTRACR